MINVMIRGRSESGKKCGHVERNYWQSIKDVVFSLSFSRLLIIMRYIWYNIKCEFYYYTTLLLLTFFLLFFLILFYYYF